MNDTEKIKKLKTLDLLLERIDGCFGDQDKIFAGHPLDEKRAKELRKEAHENSVSLKEMQNIVAGYLVRSGFYAEHVIKQTKKATAFFAKKLS